MIHSTIRREIAERYHRALPDEIRTYLKGRGIPATIIERELLGWDDARITIPIRDAKGEVLGFRYARISEPDNAVEMQSDLSLGTTLYGWDRLVRAPRTVILTDSEFDRLFLEGRGYGAVASTGRPGEILEEWLPQFSAVKHVYICFRRDLPGRAAAAKVRRLLSRAHVVLLPPEVGNGGTVTDFFLSLGRTRIDFEVLLAKAADEGSDGPDDVPPTIPAMRPRDKPDQRRADAIRRGVRLHEIAENYTDLHAAGGSLLGHCPFHEGREATFRVFPQNDTYRCAVCGAEGDVLRFVMDKESMAARNALVALERFQVTHELYGTS